MITKKWNQWRLFTIERFHPSSHFPMILFFVIAHQSITQFDNFNPMDLVVAFLFSAIFFFKLRLYDEIKDFEVDKVINPHRPLARGLLQKKNLYRMILISIILEILILSFSHAPQILTALIPITYSLLMFKEFFIGKYLRPHLTTYAITHTFVCLLLSLCLFSIFTKTAITDFNSDYFKFALASWLLFNIFEFGRKTFASSEERPNVESYSKIWGRAGATGLVLTQAVICLKIFSEMLVRAELKATLLTGFVMLFLISATFVKTNAAQWAKYYRIASQAFILFVYLLFSTQYLMRLI